MSLETDNRFYFIVDHLDPIPQVYTMTLVNILSVAVSSVMFYVTISKSKNESKLYRSVSFVHNLSLFTAQFYWGSILNPVPLLPLPGVFSIGLLKPFVSTFVLLIVWILLFALSIFMMFMILLIRLRVLARKHHLFHFRDPTYAIALTFIAISIFVPVLSRVLPHYSSEEFMINHVQLYYPKCVKLASSPGFFVFVNTCRSTKGVYLVLFSLFGGASLYLTICGVIIFEIRMQSTVWTVNKTRNHIKVLRDTIVQNVFRFIFLAIAPSVVLRNTFQPPEADTINITLFANALFVAAPIPCAVVILFQNYTYRSFLLSKLHFLRRSAPANQDSTESKSVLSTTAARSTTLL